MKPYSLIAPPIHLGTKSRFLRLLLSAAFVSGLPLSLFAGSATWSAAPTNNDWNMADNWVPAAVPNGIGDTASFATSNITQISSSQTLQLAGLTFQSGASPYILTADLTLYGAGVVNSSGVTQNIVASESLTFTAFSTAGSQVVYAQHGTLRGYGIGFYGASTAASATFMIIGDDPDFFGGAWLHFDDVSSAANSLIVNEADVTGAVTDFFDSSTAGNSTISVDANSYLFFQNFAKGGDATLIANGGRVSFQESSTGEAARVELTNGGELDLSSHSFRGLMSIGSLEGDSTGLVSLGALQLTVGGNGLSTVFEGNISGAGSLAKAGSESLTLTGANTYSGGTIVNSGTLMVAATAGSATGTGAVSVNGGIFGGTGKVSGAVTVGSGTSGKASLAPGVKGPGMLKIAKNLTFKSNGNYNFELALTPRPKADQVIANGVTITSGAKFNLRSKGTETLASGTRFTVINNTSASPISGTFSNLADGSTIIAGNNTLFVSYSGGDGNDLTLTVQ